MSEDWNSCSVGDDCNEPTPFGVVTNTTGPTTSLVGRAKNKTDRNSGVVGQQASYAANRCVDSMGRGDYVKTTTWETIESKSTEWEMRETPWYETELGAIAKLLLLFLLSLGVVGAIMGFKALGSFVLGLTCGALIVGSLCGLFALFKLGG